MFPSFGYKLSAERNMTSFCIFSIYFDACDIIAVHSVFSKWENEGTKQSRTVRLSTSAKDSPENTVSKNYSHNLPVSDIKAKNTDLCTIQTCQEMHSQKYPFFSINYCICECIGSRMREREASQVES